IVCHAGARVRRRGSLLLRETLQERGLPQERLDASVEVLFLELRVLRFEPRREGVRTHGALREVVELLVVFGQRAFDEPRGPLRETLQTERLCLGYLHEQ